MTSFFADVRTSEKMMTSSTSFTKTVINLRERNIFRWFLRQIVYFIPFFPTIYHTRVFEVIFKKSIFRRRHRRATVAAGRPWAEKKLSQNVGDKILGKVKKFGYPIISRLKVLNRFIWPRVIVTPPPVWVGLNVFWNPLYIVIVIV